jgi:hypothetical protein
MRVACTCLLVVVLTAGAAAQPSAPPPGARLTLGEAIVRATETSHRLAELRAREGAARAAVGGRAAARRPTVAAQLGYTRTNRVEEFGVRTPDGAFRLLYPDVPDNYRSRLELQWPIYTGGRLEALERAAQAEAEATGRELAAARADLRLETTRSFWALVTALEAATVVERAVARVDAQLRDVRSRFEAGFVPPSDVLLVEAQRSRQQMLLIEARNQAAVAEAELARLVGLPDGSRLEVEAALDDPAGLEVTASEGLLEAARRARPERAALESRVGAAVERQAGAAAGGRPALGSRQRRRLRPPEPAHLPARGHVARVVGRRRRVHVVALGWRPCARRARRGGAAVAAARERLAEFDSLLALEVRQRVLDLEAARAQIAASRRRRARRHRGAARRPRAVLGRRGDQHRAARRGRGAAPGRPRSHARARRAPGSRAPARSRHGTMMAAIVVRDLTRRFGDFTAVDACRSTSPRARSSASSARTARASPRPSACSAACCEPRRLRARRGRRRRPRSGRRQAAHRLHVAALLALRVAHRRREHPLLRRHLRPRRVRGSRRAARSCSTWPACGGASARWRAISRAAGASGSPSAAPSSTSRRSCSSTSRRAASTRSRGASSGT